MRQYGLPYQGSKSRLAERIVALLPPSEHFHDLFAGGCAITHRAAVCGKYRHVHANDISDAPSLFIDAAQGKYTAEDRWISREDFYALKDTDPYVRIVWSFSNNQRDYIYSKASEPFKKAMHYAVYFQDHAPLARYGIDVSDAVTVEDRYQRWLQVKHIVESKKSCECRLSHWERHHSTCAGLPPPQHHTCDIQVTRGDYRDVEILPDSVVYADPPYDGTRGYGKEEAFDTEAFCQWVRQRDFPVYVSEYAMPEDFVCIAAFSHRSTYSATANNAVIERIFVHERWKDKITKTSLFQ